MKMDNSASEDILEKFKTIKSLLSKRTLPITSSYLSKQFNISQLESSALLSEFLLHEEKALLKYIILFQIEQIKDDQVSIVIIPSYSKELESILTSNQTLSFSTFAIINKSTDFSLNNYKTFIVPNELESRYDFNIVHPVKPPTTQKIVQRSQENNKDQCFNQDFNSKLNVIDQNEENMYGGYKPKKQEQNDVKRKINESNEVIQSKKLTKKKNNIASSSTAQSQQDIRSTTIIESKKHFEEQEDNKSNDNSSKMDIDENAIAQIEPDDNQPKKVLKKRKVKKTNQKLNEKGYLVTEDEWVEEEYWSDERPIKKIKPQQQQPQVIQGNKKGKKAANGQSSIYSFFGK